MNVAFHLYFPGEAEARKAADTLTADGFTVETRPSADAAEWLAFASGEIPDRDFDDTQRRMQVLARSLGGRFDGYEEDA